jgi:hypothetical protein
LYWIDHFGPTKIADLGIEQVKIARKGRFSQLQQCFCSERKTQMLALGSIWYYQFDQQERRRTAPLVGGFCVDEAGSPERICLLRIGMSENRCVLFDPMRGLK